MSYWAYKRSGVMLILAGMSTTLDAADKMTMEPVASGSWFHWLGLAVICIILLQSLVMFSRMLRRFVQQERINNVALKVWDNRVKIAETRFKQQVSEQLSWNGYRKFEIVRKEPESESITSFYLAPHDKKPIPTFKPGQYLTFRLKIPGKDKPVVRCYSLSDAPREGTYRVSIKRAAAPYDRPELPPGLSSSYFHDDLEVGDILDVQAPSGGFHLDPLDETPVVLISAGVGLTPVLSMLNAITEAGTKREVWFFHGTYNKANHAMREHMQRIAAEHDNVHLHIVYSHPGASDIKGEDYQHTGHVGVDLFKQLLPSNNYEYYMCGPPQMMKDVVDGLTDWKVPENKIFYEAFGPASIKKKPAAAAPAKKEDAIAIEIEFSKSGKKLQWDDTAGSILEFAESNGISLDSGCRAGNCGTCLNAIISGEVTYTSEPDNMPEAGSCLTCCSIPKNNLVLDA
jgi:ferredoxin-NADP reductase